MRMCSFNQRNGGMSLLDSRCNIYLGVRCELWIWIVVERALPMRKGCIESSLDDRDKGHGITETRPHL